MREPHTLSLRKRRVGGAGWNDVITQDDDDSADTVCHCDVHFLSSQSLVLFFFFFLFSRCCWYHWLWNIVVCILSGAHVHWSCATSFDFCCTSPKATQRIAHLTMTWCRSRSAVKPSHKCTGHTQTCVQHTLVWGVVVWCQDAWRLPKVTLVACDTYSSGVQRHPAKPPFGQKTL